jgi:hypothetical protein
MPNQPFFANPPKQFPQRQPNPPPQKVTQTVDVQYQLICPCGSELFENKIALFRVPGQVIGTVDVTMNQVFVCMLCDKPVDLMKTKTRKELDSQEEETPEGA